MIVCAETSEVKRAISERIRGNMVVRYLDKDLIKRLDCEDFAATLLNIVVVVVGGDFGERENRCS
jgi:hypothetical protein